MSSRPATSSQVEAARELRRMRTDGQSDLAKTWLKESGARVLAQESGRHLEHQEADTLAEAYASAGVRELLAIVTDSLVVEDEVYAIDASSEDLDWLSGHLVGLNFLLTDHLGERLILFTADDFKLIAGPFSFVVAVAGDPSAARVTFTEFAATQLEEFQDVLRRAIAAMDWVK